MAPRVIALPQHQTVESAKLVQSPYHPSPDAYAQPRVRNRGFFETQALSGVYEPNTFKENQQAIGVETGGVVVVADDFLLNEIHVLEFDNSTLEITWGTKAFPTVGMTVREPEIHDSRRGHPASITDATL